MTTNTVYLSPGQARALRELLDGEQGVTITQVDLLEGDRFAGEIVVSTTNESLRRFDCEGEPVEWFKQARA